jgi:hypothetical protein
MTKSRLIHVVYALGICMTFTSVAYAKPVIRVVSTEGTDSGDCIYRPWERAGDCRTIQFAIDTAADGDTIRVRQGVYDEALYISNRNGLLIEGDGFPSGSVNSTIIQGHHDTSQVRIHSSSNIEIRHLTIRGGGTLNDGGGVQAVRSSVELRNLILSITRLIKVAPWHCTDQWQKLSIV